MSPTHSLLFASSPNPLSNLHSQDGLMPEILSDSRTSTGKCTGSYQVIKNTAEEKREEEFMMNPNSNLQRDEQRREKLRENLNLRIGLWAELSGDHAGSTVRHGPGVVIG
ncbi:hypothetical protein PIB30_052181 [Stylosanthes scabra]|uniref:Uncharacterized protein n=1 Tax=Stylosanthes scabra TaxID=79078 RepID=A0ABU6UJM3_9FABA|nr:hypothetical protein [Stylosanthes scabra]